MSKRDGFGAGLARRVFTAALLALGWVGPLQAQTTIPITSTAQEVTNAAPTGVANGNCTLGEAIRAANTGAAVDGCAVGGGSPYTLVLAPGAVYTLTEPAIIDAFIGSSGVPHITSAIVLRGQGARLERAAGAPAFRFFQGMPSGTLRVESLTLAKGFAQTVGVNNQSGQGAVVQQDGASVSFVDCTLVDNAASVDGAIAAVYIGTLSLLRTDVRTWNSFSAIRQAGPFANQVNVANSSFSGGLRALVVSGSALSALRMSSSTLLASTVSVQVENGGSAVMQNSVLGAACVGPSTGSGNSTFFSVTGCPGILTNLIPGSLTYGSFGGAKSTFAFLPPSNLLDSPGSCTFLSAGNNPLFTDSAPVTSDQRGFPRPAGAACDIGAFESQFVALDPGSLPGGTVGGAYSQTLTGSAGIPPYQDDIAAGVVHGGVLLGGTGTLAGTPTQAGTFAFTARVRAPRPSMRARRTAAARNSCRCPRP